VTSGHGERVRCCPRRIAVARGVNVRRSDLGGGKRFTFLPHICNIIATCICYTQDEGRKEALKPKIIERLLSSIVLLI